MIPIIHHRQDGYYPDFNPDDYYNQGQEKATIAELVGSDDLADEYIKENSMYMTRGHLAPNSDFIYYSQQVCWQQITNCNQISILLTSFRMPPITFMMRLLSGSPSMVTTG